MTTARRSSDFDGSPRGVQLSRRFSRWARVAGKVVFSLADRAYGPYPGPRLLIYHQVGSTLGREMEVTEDQFRAHLDLLERDDWEVVDLETALARRGDPDADRLVVLTFDDGYESLYTTAFPLLEERGFSFTLYLTTEPVESGTSMTPEGAPLTWDQIDEILETGLMTLGAHTHRHPDLRRLDEGEIVEELELSNRLIEQRTGITPSHFAYPYGYWSEIAEPLVRDHYETAVLGAGAPVLPSTDPHRVHRLPIQHSDGVTFFRHKLSVGLRVEEIVRRKVRGYSGVGV